MIKLKFSGSINDRAQIKRLEEELMEIAGISGWKYALVSENFQTLTISAGKKKGSDEAHEGRHEGAVPLSSSEVYLDGISLQIDGMPEPLRFTFDRNGRVASIFFRTTDARISGLNEKLSVKKYEFLYSPSVTVITADSENHIKVIKLLDYVKKRYIKDLEVTDDSMFWETRDEEELKVKFWRGTAGNKNLTF